MIEKNPVQSVGSGVAILILIIIILTGLHGLFSLFVLMAASRMEIGRDPEGKHGVSSGASRLGGLSILLSFFIGIALNIYINDSLNYKSLINSTNFIYPFSFLIGLIGLVDDFKQSLSSLFRLLAIIFIILVGLALMPNILPNKLELFHYLDEPYRWVFIYFFTTVMIAGFINAGNIADGANGLLSISYLAFFYCLNSIDPSVPNLSMIVSLLIFIIYNISTGRVFLGDFGAYFLSALVAFCSLSAYKNHDVSVFFFAAILIYPCFEITRSLFFRSLNRVSIMGADNNHLHNKVNYYFLSSGLDSHKANSMTGVLLAFISSALPTYLFIKGFSISDSVWLGIFLFEFVLLCFIYLLLSKINLKKI